MTLAIIMALTASLLWSITNHIGKFIVSDVENDSSSNIKILLVFSTLVAGIIISPIWFIISNFKVGISVTSLICILGSAILYVIASYLYLRALIKNDASIVVVMFQLIPVFSYILGLIFFKENLTINQIIGSVIIILAAVLISFDFEKKNTKDKKVALILMTLASLCYAFYYLLFDIATRSSSYNSCAFWYQIGLLLLGIIFICIKGFRNSFIKAIKNNNKKYLILNISNVVINLGGNLLINLANVTLPLALTTILNGFQGGFVFIIGFIGVKLLPKYFKEDLSKKVVIQKIVCIILCIIGLAITVIGG